MSANETHVPIRFKARWVFPVSSAPLENGVVEIQNGLITAVHARRDTAATDLGNVALIPGLVNAHTHLEFSDLSQPVQPANPFTAWIRSLVAVRRDRPVGATAIPIGLSECSRNGTALVGEIATQDWPAETYQSASIQAVVFREILGLRHERIAEQTDVARRWLNTFDGTDARIIRGLSPHAPYSVHPNLYHNLIELAVQKNAMVAIHLAETQSELEFLNRGTGEFTAMLQQFGAWDETAIPHGSRPLDYLLPLADVYRGLVVHGNYLADDEQTWLRDRSNISVIYCPRTHYFFGHEPHPWIRMLEKGINVAIGTDSRGSNPDISLWSELRFLKSRFPTFPPGKTLELGTFGGAKALGQDDRYGSLELGKWAALAVVNLQTNNVADPYDMLFAGEEIAPLKLENFQHRI